MNKKQLRKLVKVGTWVDIEWLDAPTERALVVAVSHVCGDDIDVLRQDEKGRWVQDTGIELTQVVRVIGPLVEAWADVQADVHYELMRAVNG